MYAFQLIWSVLAATLLIGVSASGEVAMDKLCKGYEASHVKEDGFKITAHLDLIGKGCSVYSPDVAKLKLSVEYETDERLHVLITDREGLRYQVPEEAFPRPSVSHPDSVGDALLEFRYTNDPFTFQILRRATREVLFDTKDGALVFERQFLRLKTTLPSNPNLYGLGEHTDTFRLPTKSFTRTFWSRDIGGIPKGENLYGNHPVYYEHRSGGTHGVLLMNSNGMDILIDEDGDGKNHLEYRTIGGVLDFYFLAGPTPREVARQYAQTVGFPAMIPYWSLGFHHCRYGYQDWFDVAEVVYNHSAAGIPLETMWTDIDYMDKRRVFTFDPDRFPLDYMQSLVSWLHKNNQHYVVMVDPAIATTDYPAYNAGAEKSLFMKHNDSSFFKGVVWPGAAVFPDWFHPDSQEYWTQQFHDTFNPKTGVDIDAVWIDMNEPSNFCDFPCSDPEGEAKRLGNPPKPPAVRDPPRKIPGFPYPSQVHNELRKRDIWSFLGSITGVNSGSTSKPAPNVEVDHSGDNLLYPNYEIHNRAGDGSLSSKTSRTDLKHANGLWEYDVHNIYGSMMSLRTRIAMLARRPGLRTLIITRSTFAGAGRYVQKWLGDNRASWGHYRSSIAGILNMASIFQIPMAGADVCGFIGHTNENLCARWTTLGAFSPFFRNHNDLGFKSQEFYLWPVVTSAAKYAIDIRYRLLDYFYTAMNRQSTDGTPALNPVWYLYPDDKKALSLELQYFYGDCILVAPVTEEDATSVEVYLPDDVFYKWDDHTRVVGHGDFITVKDVPVDRIPLFVRGGCVIPLREESALTTTELRDKNFELLVAPGKDGRASGTLYLDDGVSLDGGPEKTEIAWQFGEGILTNTTTMGAGMASAGAGGPAVSKVTVLGEAKS